MSTSAPPRLSIVIVTYNSAHEIAGCLDALGHDSEASRAEVIVVDNASSDETTRIVRDRGGVHVIDAGGNLGFARANNLGIRRASGALILLLNPDARIKPGAVQTLIGVLASRPDAAVAGPRLVGGDGVAELSFGRMISPFNELRQKWIASNAERVERLTRTAADVDWVSGACLLVRREDAMTARLLDERYFMYTEDVDFCAAIRAMGRRVLFVPEAEVVHLRGASRRSAASATEAAYRRSQLAFYQKHHPGWAPWLRLYLRLKGRRP